MTSVQSKDRTTIAFDLAGAGSPVILVSGALGSPAWFFAAGAVRQMDGARRPSRSSDETVPAAGPVRCGGPRKPWPSRNRAAPTCGAGRRHLRACYRGPRFHRGRTFG